MLALSGVGWKDDLSMAFAAKRNLRSEKRSSPPSPDNPYVQLVPARAEMTLFAEIFLIVWR
jgi:hypothetical protein